MSPVDQPPRRLTSRGTEQPARRQPRPHRQGRDPYRPEWSVVLAVSPQMRARYPDSPLSLDEALQRGKEQPGDIRPVAGQPADTGGNQPPAWHGGGQSCWTELPGALTSPRRARAIVRNVLTSWGLVSLTPEAELLASSSLTPLATPLASPSDCSSASTPPRLGSQALSARSATARLSYPAPSQPSPTVSADAASQSSPPSPPTAAMPPGLTARPPGSPSRPQIAPASPSPNSRPAPDPLAFSHKEGNLPYDRHA